MIWICVIQNKSLLIFSQKYYFEILQGLQLHSFMSHMREYDILFMKMSNI